MTARSIIQAALLAALAIIHMSKGATEIEGEKDISFMENQEDMEAQALKAQALADQMGGRTKSKSRTSKKKKNAEKKAKEIKRKNTKKGNGKIGKNGKRKNMKNGKEKRRKKGNRRNVKNGKEKNVKRRNLKNGKGKKGTSRNMNKNNRKKHKIKKKKAKKVAGLRNCVDGCSDLIIGMMKAARKQHPKITQFHITSRIQFRYAQTLVTSVMKNFNNKTAEQVHFSVVIPNSAFISNFSMVIDDVEYVAKVQFKEDAEKIYKVALEDGKGAGLVTQRSSNKFSFSANLEPGKLVKFKLTYDELLERRLGKYQHLINVNPGQVVDDFKIQVLIDESLPILSLKVPELKESNDINFKPDQDSNIAVIERDIDGDPSKAKITFAPGREYQEKAGEQGVNGQLRVEYEVDRKGRDSDIQVIDGYFVHYFAPENLPTLPKYTVFVLDISGSMFGEKMDQLKDAMFTILNDMDEKDFFNILTFSTSVSPWTLGRQTALPSKMQLENRMLNRKSIRATKENRDEAIKYIIGLSANGGTNINEALLEGLRVITDVRRKEELATDVQPLLVFLTDGLPSSGVTSRDLIISNVATANQALNVPIYSLGFGRDADFDLIKQISEDAGAFSRHIYEGSDAALQLEDFFSQIASPVLANVRFDYVGGLVDNSSITDTTVDTLFGGGEYIIAGDLNQLSSDGIDLIISGDGKNGTKYEEKIKICLRTLDLPNKTADRSRGNSRRHGNALERRNSIPSSAFGDGALSGQNVTDIQNYPSIINNQSIYNCIPSLPSPNSPVRSGAQNFLKKLHAFLNIKQLLKKGKSTVNNSSLETPRAKAQKIALDNNFVTELTSLVVVRPNEEHSIVQKAQNKEIQPTYNSGIAHSYIPQNRVSVIGSRRASRRRDHSSRSRWSSRASRRNHIPRPVSTGFSAGEESLTFSHSSSYSGGPVRGYPGSQRTPPFKPVNNSSICNMNLYDKTYFRGANFTIFADNQDFGELGFDNKLVSMKVEGACCWNLYTLKDFGGAKKKFSEGNFSSVTSVGVLFRDASSAKQIPC